MIEIEKKFQLNPGDEERLLSGATFKKEVVNTDTYWDAFDFVLSRKDWWLRQRNGRWELKVALHEMGARKHSVDQYDELETEPEIRSALALAGDGPFEKDARAAGYAPFCVIVTTRRKYEIDDFHIDLDAADFGFTVCEIETMVADETEKDAAAERILQFASSRGLSTDVVRGKVLEYLSRFRPDHYRVLEEAGVVW